MANMLDKFYDMHFDSMAILGLDGEFKLVERSFSQALGWKLDDLVGVYFWDIVILDEQVDLSNIRQNLSKGHPVLFIDSQIKSKNDELFQLRWSAYPDQGSETITLIISNPTAQENSEMVKLAAEASPTAILVVSHTEIRYANQFVDKIFGYPKNELIGQPVELLIPSRLKAVHLARQNQYNRKPYLRLMGTKYSLTGQRKDGKEFPVAIGLNPVQTPDGLVVVCSIIDLTKRKETEKNINNKIRHLENRISKLDKLSKTDALTATRNRRELDIQLELRYHIAQKNGEAISFILLDIDDFKGYNDSFGHQAGDEVLKFIAKIITLSLRRSEIIARYGGEEFGIILPDSNIDDTLHTAERIRKAIEEFECPFRHITVSIGCATLYPKVDLNPDPEEITDIIRMADQALYFSKRSGKNQVTHYGQLILHPEELSGWEIQYKTPLDR
jgi:diguanylate cyclase (GGDEF)-like protein/PAS domain S-box-containing protein